VLVQNISAVKGRCNTNFAQQNTHKVETSKETWVGSCSSLYCTKKLSEIFECNGLLRIQKLVSSPLCVKLTQSCTPKHILDHCCKRCLTVEDPKEYRHNWCAGTV